MLFVRSGWGLLVLPVAMGTATAVGVLGGSTLEALGHPVLIVLAVFVPQFALRSL